MAGKNAAVVAFHTFRYSSAEIVFFFSFAKTEEEQIMASIQVKQEKNFI